MNLTRFFLIPLFDFPECVDLGAICPCGKTERNCGKTYFSFGAYAMLMVSVVLLKYFDEMIFKISEELFKMYWIDNKFNFLIF